MLESLLSGEGIMAQLSKDSFAVGGKLMSVEESVALISSRVTPVAATETVALTEADGHVLARSVVAPIDLPPFDNSAVDGYAVRFADLAVGRETVLPVEGRVAAGSVALNPIAPGRAVRIFTGAPMPGGADTVYMQEDARLDAEGRVVLPAGLALGANRRLAGEDVAKGTPILHAGRRLVPQDIALLAALGVTRAEVRRPIRIAILSTGDEIVSPGEPLRGAAIYDSNRFLLMALARRLGADVTDFGIVRDKQDLVAQALGEAAAAHDLILSSGGVSTGEEDHVKAAVESAGSLVFWRLAIKPGRPVAMGVVGGIPFVGLPGNPVAVFVTFAHVVRPLVARLGGAEFEGLRALPVRAGFSYKKKEGRREYVRVSLRAGANMPEAHKHPRDGAGVITSLTETDGLAELPEAITQVQPGDVIGFFPYSALR